MRLLVLGSIHGHHRTQGHDRGRDADHSAHPPDRYCYGIGFHTGLSAEAKHFRFLGAVRELPLDELARLCDVDGKHSMAFVATVSRNGREMEIGVSRYAPNSRSDVREIAVTVADEWHHRGVGTLLMKQLIQTARTNGVKQLYSVDLRTTPRCARSRRTWE